MERLLPSQIVEGEIALEIDYRPGQALAVDVLAGTMGMIAALDTLDAALLASVDTSLEPVSVLNDVQHASLKILLARAPRRVPDDLIGNLDWKKWVGGLLVAGKHKLLPLLDADAPRIQRALAELEPDYRKAPAQLAGYHPPLVSEVRDALDHVARARGALAGQVVSVQTELGDIELMDIAAALPEDPPAVAQTLVNRGVELFKVKSPDMLGAAQWTVLRNGRSARVDMLHQRWLDAYHRREFVLAPGDALKCRFEERVGYDAAGNEIERRVAVIEVLDVVSPPEQKALDLGR